MKFLYVTDLHGFEWKYDFILRYVIKNRIPLVINGGDLLPKGNSIHEEQATFIKKYLFHHFRQYQKREIYYLFILGNDDLKIFDDSTNGYISAFSYIKNLALQPVVVNGFNFYGFDLVKDAPFLLKDRFRRDLTSHEQEPETVDGILSNQNGFDNIDWTKEYYLRLSLEDELNKIKLDKNENNIFVIHQPPSGYDLSKVYSGKDVGSKAVKYFIEEKQPLTTFHGHIHESPKVSGKWSASIGRTIAIQPGQEDDLIFVEGDLKEKYFERKVISCNKYFYVNKH